MSRIDVNLTDYGSRAVWTDGEGEHSDCPLAELARFIGQYSQVYCQRNCPLPCWRGFVIARVSSEDATANRRSRCCADSNSRTTREETNEKVRIHPCFGGASRE